MIGAYREMSPQQSQLLLIEDIKHSMTIIGTQNVTTIKLAPLTFNDVHRWIRDTLHCSSINNTKESYDSFSQTSEAQRCEPLAQLVFQRSEGNPFYVKMLMQVSIQI